MLTIIATNKWHKRTHLYASDCLHKAYLFNFILHKLTEIEKGTQGLARLLNHSMVMQPVTVRII